MAWLFWNGKGILFFFKMINKNLEFWEVKTNDKISSNNRLEVWRDRSRWLKLKALTMMGILAWKIEVCLYRCATKIWEFCRTNLVITLPIIAMKLCIYSLGVTRINRITLISNKNIHKSNVFDLKISSSIYH